MITLQQIKSYKSFAEMATDPQIAEVWRGRAEAAQAAYDKENPPSFYETLRAEPHLADCWSPNP